MEKSDFFHPVPRLPRSQNGVTPLAAMNQQHSSFSAFNAKQDSLAPPIWRDRFGAAVLAQESSAHRRFGAGRFGATIGFLISCGLYTIGRIMEMTVPTTMPIAEATLRRLQAEC